MIRLTVMMYVRFPLSLRQVEDLLLERGFNICLDANLSVDTTSFVMLSFGLMARVFAVAGITNIGKAPQAEMPK